MIRACFLIVLLGLASTAHAESFSLQLDSRGLPSSEVGEIESFLKKAETLLPRSLKSYLSRPITVRFEKLDASSRLQIPPCIGDQPDPNWENQKLASVRRSPFADPTQLSELLLSQHLRSVISAGEDQAPSYACGHRNAYRLALASVIHEVGHIYDYADTKSPEERRFLAQCSANRSANPKVRAQGENPQCRILRNRLRVSNRSSFLDLMGWVETGLIFHSRGQSNQLTLRSPDPYEFKNWKESFAVNLEYFVLDPEFACRRPAVHAFYAQHFGYDPHPSRTCKPQTTLTLASEFGSGKVNVADINPDRVYEIHALFAGRGPQVMSKWGHSLYRIVVCAPDRKQVGPECLNDITHHVAISFRANVSDASISYLKGLSGDYPSLLFAQSLLSVIEEYNKNEFRELTSLPLRLNQQEKNFFLYRTLEAFWEYGGRYKFITNNCATEALNFLKGTLGETRLNSAHPLSPLGLHKTLQKLGVVDATVLQNPQQAAEKGYFYGSKKPEVEMAFAGVQKSATLQGVAFPKDVDQYLEKTSAEQRRLWFTTLEPSRGETRQVQASRFFLLESYVARRANSAYNKRIAKVIEANRFDGLPQEAVESAGKIRAALSRLREIQQLSLPSSIQSDGYGIPISRSESSSEEPAVSVPPELLAEQRKLAQQVIEWAKVAFSTWIGEIEAIQKNRLQFLREMREQRKPPNQTGGPGSLN